MAVRSAHAPTAWRLHSLFDVFVWCCPETVWAMVCSAELGKACARPCGARLEPPTCVMACPGSVDLLDSVERHTPEAWHAFQTTTELKQRLLSVADSWLLAACTDCLQLACSAPSLAGAALFVVSLGRLLLWTVVAGSWQQRCQGSVFVLAAVPLPAGVSWECAGIW